MILVGIGANLASVRAGPPYMTCKAALSALAEGPPTVKIAVVSPWYRSAPVPASDQPWFINGVARVETELDAEALLLRLHEVEDLFGRSRSFSNAPRVLDLDLLAYDDLILTAGTGLQLPHPRLHQRIFVLAPLCDLVPSWRHPTLNRTAAEMLEDIDDGQIAERLSDN